MASAMVGTARKSLALSCIFSGFNFTEIYGMESPEQPQIRILLAEDDAAMRKAVKLNFVREG